MGALPFRPGWLLVGPQLARIISRSGFGLRPAVSLEAFADLLLMDKRSRILPEQLTGSAKSTGVLARRFSIFAAIPVG